jgi:hypothetical protein
VPAKAIASSRIAGIIAIAITGSARPVLTSSRCRSRSSAVALSSDRSVSVASGAGTCAVYPAACTWPTSCSGETDCGYRTFAFSVAKLTVAVTPSILPSRFSMRAAQDAQVIPLISSSIER